MTFQPRVGDELTIDTKTYRIAEHPAAPGMPYGQEGRQGVVYKLQAGAESRALKVFKPRYRFPLLVSLAERLESYAGLPGLAVCRRTVLSAQRHTALLRKHPDLTYAVLMPWIEGPTWMQVLLEKRALTADQSLAVARSLAAALVGMEEQGLAHCDLSAPNVMLPMLAGGQGVALVDVEQMYGPDLRRPPLLPGGLPGYAHKTAPDGLWTLEADRFAAAVLLAEMLGACDAWVRGAAWGENYFDPREVQAPSERYQLLKRVLRERWGAALVGLLERAWQSDSLLGCATFGEWLALLPEEVPQAVAVSAAEAGAAEAPAAEAPSEAVRALMDLAGEFEAAGKLEEALQAYRQALTLAPEGSGVAQELAMIVAQLDERRSARQEPGAGSSIHRLFADGLAAYERKEWAKAKELLAEVVRRERDFEQDGQRAVSLLSDAQRRLAGRPSPVLLGGVLVVALILVAILWVTRQSQATAREQATATAQAGSTLTAVGRGSATVEAQAATMAAARGTATAQAEMTAAAFADATSTASAQATGTALARATGTSVAAWTAAASSAGTATAEAIARLARPTATAVPRVPQLITPDNDAEFTGYVDMEFAWQAVGQPLGADEYYALVITFQHKDGKRYPYLQAWTKETRWQGKLESFLYDSDVLADRSTGWQHGWYVVVMQNPGRSDTGEITGTEISGRSEERSFTWKLDGGGPVGPSPALTEPPLSPTAIPPATRPQPTEPARTNTPMPRPTPS